VRIEKVVRVFIINKNVATEQKLLTRREQIVKFHIANTTKESCPRNGSKSLPVTSDGLETTVVSTERDVESDDGLTGLDEVEVLLADASGSSGILIEKFDLLKETGLVVLIELGPESVFLGVFFGNFGSHGERAVHYTRDHQLGRNGRVGDLPGVKRPLGAIFVSLCI